MPQLERWDNLPKRVRQHLTERMLFGTHPRDSLNARVVFAG
jgi:hypothetical protein